MTEQNKQSKLLINENVLATVVPGMLMSAKTLIEFDDFEWKKGDPNAQSIGNMIATIMITSQCTELLLKYKIEQEGGRYKKTHDLYTLYKTLKEESKVSIQKEFNELKLTVKLPNGWDTAESVFLKARKAFVYWRYVVSSPNYSLTIYPQPLYIAAVSVYQTTPIAGLKFTREEVTDQAVKEAVFGNTTR